MNGDRGETTDDRFTQVVALLYMVNREPSATGIVLVVPTQKFTATATDQLSSSNSTQVRNKGGKEKNSHIGVTPTNGAETPAYSPYTGKSTKPFDNNAAAITHPRQTLSRNCLLHTINGPRIHSLLSRLQPDLYQIKRMPNNNCADTTNTTSSEGPNLCKRLVYGFGVFGGCDIFFDGCRRRGIGWGGGGHGGGWGVCMCFIQIRQVRK